MSNSSVTIIEQFIAKLRQQVCLNLQQGWRDITLLSIINISSNLAQVNLEQCSTATVNDHEYIVFAKGKQVKWLAQQIIIPPTLQGYPLSGLSLRLVLTWWAEDAQIFINGKLVQQGDLFDSSARVLITENAQPGTEYLVTIRLVSPHHDIGALMRSHLVYEKLDSPHQIDPGLVADELSILLKYLSQFEPEAVDTLAGKLAKFSWNHLQDVNRFTEDLSKLRSQLFPLAKNIKQRCFNLLGHAHLDMAWLWTTDETYEVAERTFKSVLNLQQDFPALTFGHTSPALYQWIEINRPQLFDQIKNAVRLNKWELLGGMWIEPETNLVSGESLIRQLLYGQQYYQQKFGQISQVAWLPDSFGFTWQLPQIFAQCGIEYFVTGKLHWNDTTQFPHGCFWWESPDGTQLLTLMSPPNVTGVMDTNPITMSNYAVDWEVQTGLPEIFWLPGVGDHGGGPTRDMLEVAAKWHHSPFFPQINYSTATNYLNKLSQSPNKLPVWKDELYLELHRGCYTVHAEQKKYNRYGERLLYQAELWSTIATLLCSDKLYSQTLLPNVNTILEKAGFCQAHPQKLIELAWKKVLFNQFHDILPGTSIPEVFTEANQDWETAIALGENLLANALQAIAQSIKLPEPPCPNAQPVVVFNSLNWQRSEIVTVKSEKISNSNLAFWICNQSGQDLNSDINQSQSSVSFLAQDIPGVGYKLYWLCCKPSTAVEDEPINYPGSFQLENNYLKVTINAETGDLDSVIEQKNHREILAESGNKLQFFADQGQYWDAWNIDPDYANKQLSDSQLISIKWIANSNLQQTIRVVKQFNQSQFIQDYILGANSPYLKITNRVDWQETQVMVKVAFPLNITSDYLVYEIPCATISRSIDPQTPAAKAKWEVPALNWADLSDRQNQYGVSLLNDCKHGYDVQGDYPQGTLRNQLRLTLLRSPVWPDPQSDRGVHHFTYALYPHQNDYREAKTIHKGYELTTPLQTVLLEKNKSNCNYLPPTSELINLSAENLFLMALKLNSAHEIVLRCYESDGKPAAIKIKSDLNLQLDTRLNCLEQSQNLEAPLSNVPPYKIATFKLNTN